MIWSTEQLLPVGETGKTEAWVVLEGGTESRVYAGLKPGTTAGDLQLVLTNRVVVEYLVCFTPKPGDGVFLPAGTVHALAGGGRSVCFSTVQCGELVGNCATRIVHNRLTAG